MDREVKEALVKQAVPEVFIPGMQPDTLRIFLSIAYDKELIVTMENLSTLYQLATNYDVGFVKDACSKFMENGMTVENCLDMQAVALDLMDKRDLNAEFIAENFDEIVETEGFLKVRSLNVASLCVPLARLHSTPPSLLTDTPALLGIAKADD